MIICPICETENKPQATHCEVCGERLTPPAPGEVLSPEESVGAMLQEATPERDPEMPSAPAPTPELVAPQHVPEAAPAPAVSSLVPDDFDAPAAPVAPAPTPPAPTPPAPTPVAPAPVAPAPAPVAPAPVAPARPAAPATPPPQIRSSGIPNARLVVYQNKQPAYTHPVVNDETLIGRYDPVSGSYPELDLTPYDAQGLISRKHAYIYRLNNEFYLYPVSNAGTQLGQALVDMGTKQQLGDGDVIILSASLAMKFHLD